MARDKVAILMGSDSDLEVMSEAVKALQQFDIEYDIKVMSAHRSPDLVREFVTAAESNGIRVFIAGAGAAAHLAGVIAAHTHLPVIGVPISATSLGGFDSLLSTVQMPPGIPVATVAVGKMGSKNAGILAAQIIAQSSEVVASKLKEYKKSLVEGVKKKNETLQDKLSRFIS